MYLKRIEIIGFKSFAQKSVIDFDVSATAGITAVVGPNGSGKSNVADAIRWVTGEQSGKNMRSKKSEDVIFCGSTARPRGSFAQVTILLADKKSFKFQVNGKDYELSELEISRKLFRSGDSDYLINNKKVRLTDIQQLLASLGFGQSSYTVIGQGMVDRLLFFSASERKILFDEAAGVKQYEIKREQSIRKLESTDMNLIRLRDILTELEPRVTNLRRLVKRAEGRKDFENEIKIVQQKYFGSLLFEYNGLVSTTDAKKADLLNKINDIEKNIEKLEIESREIKNNPHSEERLLLESEIRQESDRRDKLREEVAFLKGQIDSAKNSLEQRQVKKVFLYKEKEDLTSRVSVLDLDIKNENKLMTEITKKRGVYQEELLSAEADIETLGSDLLNLKNDSDAEEIQRLENKQAALISSKEELSNKLYLIRQESNIANARLEQNKKTIFAATESLRQLNIKYTSICAKTTDLEKKKSELVSALASKDKDIQKLSKTLLSAESELSVLAHQVTDGNLEELEAEIVMVSDAHQKLRDLVSLAKNENDFAAIKNEFKGFGANLEKIINRFRSVTKAINNSERDKLENLLLEIRAKNSVFGKELQSIQFDLIRVESEISSLESIKKDVSISISEKEKEINTLSSVKILSKDSNIENHLAIQINKLSEEINLGDIDIRKYNGALSERQNAILKKRDKLQISARELRQAAHNVDMELSRKESMLINLKNNLEKSQSRLESIAIELSELDLDSSKGNDAINNDLEERERQLSKLEEDIAKLRGGLTQILAKEREFEQKGHALEREKSELEKTRLHVQNELSALEVASAKVAMRLESLTEEINNSGINISSEDKYEVLDQMEKDVLKLKIENVRRKLDTTIGIDPETEAEYQELEARATEMSSQVDDLIKAKSDLEKVVRELDERIKIQFSGVFKNIASEFNRYFTMLFSGGSANLSLGESEDGNFGIDISANPPGKRVQSLNALSGGERSLTSLALLFAILSVNPSPFVVLDEVDAALDESNTVRYVNILEDLAKKTQFIVISHNRETMKSATQLYGVTMDESHISKLLSVRLTEALISAK